jgi:hypothetical protein
MREIAVSESTTGRRAPSAAVVDRVVCELRPMLERYGVSAVLALLNARTRYRFTGVYRLEPPLLRNVHLYDRENPSLEGSGGSDPRVAPGAMPSSLGVPIRGADGRVSGMLCHFDSRPRLVPAGEELVLARVATAFAARLLAPPSRRGRPAE